ncbi:uncharacterized protein LOC130671559 [Microplitis mediator]|uniref:uncharacterized protein LOC130671559 n=1 Tax=Microplitis mediator TaxID=375433 RepID=UPI002553F062|nr:uncharacterized protein LOC130671559 [Microplitis mediator]
MAKNIILLLTFFSFCIAITLARRDTTGGRFHYRCLQNSAIVSYDASEFNEVKFSVWGRYPKCDKYFHANEKAQWEINFHECAEPGTRRIYIDISVYSPRGSDASRYSVDVDCDNQGR